MNKQIMEPKNIERKGIIENVREITTEILYHFLDIYYLWYLFLRL